MTHGRRVVLVPKQRRQGEVAVHMVAGLFLYPSRGESSDTW